MKVPYLVRLDVECFLIVLHLRLFLNIFYMYQNYRWKVLGQQTPFTTTPCILQRVHTSEMGMRTASGTSLVLGQEKAWFGFGLPEENTKGISITATVSRGLVICLACKYKCISHRSLKSTHTVIFGYYLPGPDADWKPEGERLWTKLLIPWTTDSPGSLFVKPLIFMRKLRGISTTNRKGVDISNFIFNYRKSLAGLQVLIAP